VLGEQCLLGHPAVGDIEGELRRIELHARELGVAWPARCGVSRLYAGDGVAPEVLAALVQPAVSTEPPPAPLALPGPGDALPAAFDEVVDDAMFGGGTICRLVDDALRCRRVTSTGVSTVVAGAPVMRPATLVARWASGPAVLRDGKKAVLAATGAAIAWGEQISIGDRAYAIRDGVVVVDGVLSEKAPPDAVLVRDQLVWWDEASAQLMAKPVDSAAGGDRAVAIGGMDKGASAPDARETCAGPDVAAVRLRIGGRIAVWTDGAWQVYEAPGGPLWCRGKTVTTVAPSGERQDCTAGGCPKLGGKVRAPAGAVVAPLADGVIAAWVGADAAGGSRDELVRVELPSHRQLVAFDGYHTTKSFHGQLRVDRVGIFAVGDVALLLLHGERELAVRIAPDGTLTALRVVSE